MKTISGGLLAHIQGEVSTLATCWKITRRDAVVLAFTTHSDPLVISGVTYLSAVGSYSGSAIKSAGDMAVDNLELQVIFDSAAITESDLLGGLYDFAKVELFQVNYTNLAQGTLALRKGRIGEVHTEGGKFVTELRGLTQSLQQTIGRLYAKRCSADLFDARCTVNPAAFTVIGTVTAVTSREVITVSAVPARPGGLFTFTSGLNNNGLMEIKNLAGSVVTFNLPMPFNIAIGDAYSARAGCDKLLSTCLGIYNNVVNFRGFPQIPGPDKTIQYPNAR